MDLIVVKLLTLALLSLATSLVVVSVTTHYWVITPAYTFGLWPLLVGDVWLTYPINQRVLVSCCLFAILAGVFLVIAVFLQTLNLIFRKVQERPYVMQVATYLTSFAAFLMLGVMILFSVASALAITTFWFSWSYGLGWTSIAVSILAALGQVVISAVEEDDLVEFHMSQLPS